eukprot:3956323-Alexandrium_andersonii.AAC.1
MSASLVGSEMCIRDRVVFLRLWCVEDAFRRFQSVVGIAVSWRTPTVATVSYTHLTLPTICSV